MNITLLTSVVVLFAGQGTAPTAAKEEPLPVVVVSGAAKVDDDLRGWRPSVKLADVHKRLGPDWTLERLEHLVLVYPKNLLGIEDAAFQAGLVSRLLAAADGDLVEMNRLTPEDQAAVRRAMGASQQPGWVERAATHPNLKLQIGIDLRMQMESGGQRKELYVHPRGPSLAELDRYDDREDYSPERRLDVPPAAMKLPETEFLTYILPQEGEFGIADRFELATEAQAFLLTKAREANRTLRVATAAAIRKAMALDPTRFGRFPTEGQPRFSDLDPKEQLEVGQLFYQDHRKDFDSPAAAMEYLRNARTAESTQRLNLTASFVVGRSGPSASMQYATMQLVFIPLGETLRP